MDLLHSSRCAGHGCFIGTAPSLSVVQGWQYQLEVLEVPAQIS